MVVYHRQRMAGRAADQPHPALEVHLPQLVRRLLLEPPVSAGRTRRGNDATVPPQNLVHGRHRRRRPSLAFETPRDLARTPRRMAITQRQDPIFDRTVGPQRDRMRTPRAIRKLPIGSKAAEPLVPNLGADPKPPAQLPPVRSLLVRQPNKLATLIHNRYLSPRHGWPPVSRIHAILKCQLCPRTPVSDVPGLYNKPGDDDGNGVSDLITKATMLPMAPVSPPR